MEIANLERIFVQNIKFAKSGKERMSMTENEAIRVLKNGWHFAILLEDKQLIDMAIQALEEIQQYRAIGTVEHIQLTFELCKGLDAMTKMYSAIGTVEEFKALKDKATLKKDDNDSGRCKYCGTYNNFIINKLANPKGHPVIHCWNCGQAIDWQ